MKKKHEFYNPDGFCKVCGLPVAGRRKLCKKCYEKRNREKRKNYQRAYYRRWYKERGRKRNPNYIEITKKWQLENPEKLQARRLIEKAIRKGKIRKPKFCEKCGKERKLCGHHSNYDQPFNVIWVCWSCHKMIHQGSGSLGKT